MIDQTTNAIGSTLKALPGDRPLQNVTCVYCGAALTKETATEEHVIGRRFVPNGKLQNCWNLILKACRTCNGVKSDLEDDISAITMQPDVFGRYGQKDEAGASDGRRKAERSFSRRTRKPVKHSHEEMTVNANLGQSATTSFKFIGSPQADRQRVLALARLQVMAFFYWITFNKDARRGCFWRGGFYPILEAARSDWGNHVHRAFADAVVAWEPRVIASCADGFYKIALRKHPTADCWSWALEWNHAMRVIGFCGDLQAAQDVAAGFPKLEAQTIAHGPDATLAYRIETPLPKGEDRTFYFGDDLKG